MNRVRRSAIALFFVISLIAPSLMPSGVAGATTNYDNSLQLATSLRTSSAVAPNQACDPTDLSFDWSTYLTDESKWRPGANHSAAKVSFLAAKANAVDGAWGVHQYSGTPAHGGQRDIVEFWWTEDPTARLDWSTDGVTISTATPGANIRLASIACTNYYYGGGSSVPVVTMTASIPSYGVSTATSSSPGYTAKLLFAHGFDPNYPIGYAGPQIPADQPAAKYVAMGDSFSSGEGNPSFDPATDQDGVNECHRSPVAYPRLLQNNPSLNLAPTAFVACSGATTNDVLGLPDGISPVGKWNESAQIDALSASTEVVTITIGGNNVGFGEYAYACTIMLCGPGTFDYGHIMDVTNSSEFFRNLVQTYETILDRAPNAQIYVVDYPYLASMDSDMCGPVDLTGAWAVQNQLNAVIRDAVAETISSRLSTNIHYVNTNLPSSPFAGKHLCGEATNDFHGIVAYPNTRFSLHPNIAGQQDYAAVIGSWLS